jgi:peptide-methionine (S)-S-oxide reductase
MSRSASPSNHIALPVLAGLVALALAGAIFAFTPSSAEEARALPAPSVDESASSGDGQKVALLAGGCFWGVQGVFQHVEGVSNAVSGYAGGARASAVYEMVGSGRTGHAETVRITYDPRKISYARLLQIFFSVAHDPTQLNRQGPDVGTQYRSAIFPVDTEQARIAKAYIGQLSQSRSFDAAIVTKIEPDRTFYPAEDYHQDFLTRYPSHPYIVVNDLPKIESLKRFFPDLYRPKPALVSQASN